MNPQTPGIVQGLLTILLLAAAPVWAQPPGERLTSEAYIEMWKEVAVEKMRQHGIPASITLAQGLLESGNGNSELARKANNHFGIKCHSDWNGAKVYHDDDKRHECFRKYKDAADSFEDHSKFLQRSRYASLFELKVTDYKGWAHGLRKAGYATDPRYPQKLIDLIERYELHQLDKGGDIVRAHPKPDRPGGHVGPTGREEVTIGNGRRVDLYEGRIKFVRAKEGDTFLSLARELETMPGVLARWNDMDKNAKLGAGQRIYIQPKRNRSKSTPVYTVKNGESLWHISQVHGVKLKKLEKYNGISSGTPLSEGQRIHLRKPKR